MPVHPSEGRELEVLDRPPRSGTGGAADEFGLVVAVHGLSEGVDAPIDRQVDQAAISSSPLTGLAMASGAGSRRKSSRARYRFRHRMISRFDMPSAVRRAT